jgi:hypothetical protein
MDKFLFAGVNASLYTINLESKSTNNTSFYFEGTITVKQQKRHLFLPP